MSGAIALESPDFHFSKALTAALGLTPQRLLRNERIRTDGTHVYLILHHMVQFKDIHVPDSDFFVVRFAGAAVVKFYLSCFGKTGFFQLGLDFFVSRAHERRNDGLIIQRL